MRKTDLFQCQIHNSLNLVLVRLESVSTSVQDRCAVCAKCTIGSGIILDAPDGTTEATMKARFGRFGDSGNIDARLVHDLRRTFHRFENHFGRTRWNSSVTCVKWNLVLVRSEIV